MAFILSGGLHDAAPPSQMRPRAAMARSSIVGNARGGMLPMNTMLAPPHEYKHMPGGRDAYAPHTSAARPALHYDDMGHLRQPAQALFQSGLRSAPARPAMPQREYHDRRAGGADAVEATVIVRDRQHDAEATAHAETHGDHADVEIELHAADREGHWQYAEQRMQIVSNPPLSKPQPVTHTSLVFESNDKLLKAITAHRKSIVKAFDDKDFTAVQQQLIEVLQELRWPQVQVEHYDSYWKRNAMRRGDAQMVVFEDSAYRQDTMPVPNGEIQVLYSNKSLAPGTRIAELHGWLLPWGAYESLITVKWRKSSRPKSKKSALKAQGGSDTASSKRKHGACHSGRAKGRGFCMKKHAMHERVIGGSQYALWMLDSNSTDTDHAALHSSYDDVQSLQRAFVACNGSSDKCNVAVVHETDHDGRELTWLEITKHTPPDTLLCADMSQCYAHGP